MPKRVGELGPLQIQRLAKEIGAHSVGDVPGLRLQVSSPGIASWILRATVDGRRREVSLGPYPGVSLAQALEGARDNRALIQKGIDPVEQRRAERNALRERRPNTLTFREAAERYINAHKDEWRNAKHRQRWVNSLEQYAHPVLGAMLVRGITAAHVLRALEPIWHGKTATATRVRGRIESVLEWATRRGYRNGDSRPAWNGALSAQLASANRVEVVEHHKPMPLSNLNVFVVGLRAREGASARALELMILTGTRSGEVKAARWPEFDLARKHWTIPAERMKMGQEHRVPLSDAAIKLLRALERRDDSDIVFHSPAGKLLSATALPQVMRRMKVEGVPDDFRSCLRAWAGEHTNYPQQVVELILADKVESTYWRRDLYAKRRHLIADWAEFIDTPATNGKVLRVDSKQV